MQVNILSEAERKSIEIVQDHIDKKLTPVVEYIIN